VVLKYLSLKKWTSDDCVFSLYLDRWVASLLLMAVVCGSCIRVIQQPQPLIN